MVVMDDNDVIDLRDLAYDASRQRTFIDDIADGRALLSYNMELIAVDSDYSVIGLSWDDFWF